MTGIIRMALVLWALCGLTAAMAADRTWPHDGSDLKLDPRVTYGVLPNGLRYAIMKANKPEGHAAIRLRIAVGSLHETGKEQGLAHYLEHLAFQGSKALSRNEFVQTLQRLGLAFGPDTNARTSFDQTVYMLNLPKADAATFVPSLNLLREMADRLTIAEEAVQAEKGVILSEERVRDTPNLRAFRVLFENAYPGMLAPKRFPIGTVPTIKAATAAALRDFYQRYYRPERAMIVVTGAIDPPQVAAQIQAAFGDWTQPGPAGADPDLGALKDLPLRAANAVDPSYSETVSLSWMASEPIEAASRAGEARAILRGAGIRAINIRLARRAQAPNPPYAGASVGCDFLEQRGEQWARRCALNVTAGPGGWRKAMIAAESDLRQAILYPLDQGEIDRMLKNWRTGLEANVRAAANPDTPGMAEFILQSFQSRGVQMHPQDYLALWTDLSAQATPDALHAAMTAHFGGEPDVIVANTPKPVEGGAAALIAAYRDGRAVAIGPAKPVRQVAFPYTDFGPAGAIASKGEAPDLGLVQYAFRNGVLLNVRPGTEEPNIARVTVRLPGGYLDFPKTGPIFDAGFQTSLVGGGLGRLTLDELRIALTGRNTSTRFSVDAANYRFVGFAAREDLLLHFQMVAAYLTDPAYRPEALQIAKAGFDRAWAARNATAGSVLSWELPAILTGGDPRWGKVTPDAASALTEAAIKAQLTPVLTVAGIEVTIAGDTTPDEAAQAVAATLGALPARKPLSGALAPEGAVRFPAEAKAHTFHHAGRADQALIYFAWPAADVYANPRAARAAALAEQILATSLTQSLRDMGLTYGVGSGFEASEDVAGYGYLYVQVEAKPESLPAVQTMIEAETAKLAAGQFGDDLLTRAREPAIATRETQIKTNAYWVAALADAQARPKKLTLIRTRISDIKTVTREEIVAAAARILRPERRIEVRVLPKP
jgi:zinc protease